MLEHLFFFATEQRVEFRRFLHSTLRINEAGLAIYPRGEPDTDAALEHCLSLGILKESRQELWESDKGPRPKKGTRLKGWMQ